MNRLLKSVQIKAGFSWVDWGLYDNPGVVPVAMKLNKALEEIVNVGAGREDVRSTMTDLFQKYENFGANDSEPHAHLEEILNDIFGD